MALTNCTECGRQISDQASSCPGCGAPLGETVAAAHPTTIQATSKRYKGQMVAAVILMLVSFVVMLAGAGARGSGGVIVGALGIAAGFFWLLGARLYAWWHHG